ncbi:hypothetical protein [Tumebacillus flagellatus]|uniref:Uncharacterized protein n=1 Tax=Tumebacillus flagellatus TaxID=1157490 RepID=A0A074LL98_9BACL|nr:hypothetical protein [Tumebacillus flagellatus]KEO81889.1 hypothetical protein EL26_18810 [Tumebacillus flagellatus]
MKKVSFPHFLDHIQTSRQARGLTAIQLQDVTFLHDLTNDPIQTLDLLEEVTTALDAPVSRNTLKSDYLSPYLHYNVRDLYDAFLRIDANRKYERKRKIGFVIGLTLAGASLYELFVEVAVLPCILLALITSGIFQYLRGTTS